jgi:hypothetical protein
MPGKKASDCAAATEQTLVETWQGRNHHIISVRRRDAGGLHRAIRKSPGITQTDQREDSSHGTGVSAWTILSAGFHRASSAPSCPSALRPLLRRTMAA